MITKTQIQEMAAGYILAALFADCEPMCTCGVGAISPDLHEHEDGCLYGIESGGLEHLDVSAEDRRYVESLCRLFAERAGSNLLTFAELRSFDPRHGSVWEHIGHDLRLTSGGHGTGFWDREPDPDQAPSGMKLDAYMDLEDSFFAARARLTDLAGSAPFDSTGGGDCWQIDEDTATIEHRLLGAKA